jgi:hypothetical protein
MNLASINSRDKNQIGGAKMKTEQKTYMVELAPGIKAKYVLQRVGQQPPAKGDGVVVEATILLPARSGLLLPEILFEHRVKVAGAGLYSTWGAEHSADYRYTAQTFTSSKWTQAFADAEAWARGELQRLADALAARAKALEDAEN